MALGLLRITQLAPEQGFSLDLLRFGTQGINTTGRGKAGFPVTLQQLGDALPEGLLTEAIMAVRQVAPT